MYNELLDNQEYVVYYKLVHYEGKNAVQTIQVHIRIGDTVEEV